MVYTGDGKGKTTAALGVALRASGHGWRTLFVQFIKGTWHCGELDGVEKLRPAVEIRPLGAGFVGIMGDDLPIEEHREAARRALREVEKEMASGAWDIVVLDEVNVAVKEGLLTVAEVLEVVRSRPDWLTVILTGRYAPDSFVEAADLVTEMREVRHPFRKGIEAQKGIDF
jgi:cob(I)alamin adenosyltransferase